MLRFALLSEQGDENIKYFTPPNGNRTHNCHVYNRTLIPVRHARLNFKIYLFVFFYVLFIYFQFNTIFRIRQRCRGAVLPHLTTNVMVLGSISTLENELFISGNKTKRGVEFYHSTCNIAKTEYHNTRFPPHILQYIGYSVKSEKKTNINLLIHHDTAPYFQRDSFTN